MRRQDLAHRSLGQVGQARVAGIRPVIAGVRRQQTGRPQFVRIAELRRPGAGQPDQPGSRLGRYPRLTAGAGAIVERCQYPQFGGALQAARHRLLAHPHRARYGIGRGLVEVGQNNAGPLHPVCRFGARSSHLNQRPALIRIHRQDNNPSRSNHGSPCHAMLLHTTSCRVETILLQHSDNSESFY